MSIQAKQVGVSVDRDVMASALRMKDLIRETGLSRETIHFYIAQGLLPAGKKTSRTSSEYTQEHVDRLRRIRRLREEQLLPLHAVKSLLTDEDAGRLTADSRLYLRRATTAYDSALEGIREVPLARVPVGSLTRRDIEVLEKNGLIEIRRDGRRRMVSTDDAQIIEVFAHLREAGFTRARGYTGVELMVIDDAMEKLVASEFQISAGRLTDEPPGVLRGMAERANPFLEHLMVVMRRKKIRRMASGDAGDVDP
jgi:DNA-binding transcriptional MerR regulator